MNESMDRLTPMIERNQEQANETIDKFLAAAKPGAVFAEPVRSGEYMVITASEVMAGGGFGSGVGFGPATGEQGAARRAAQEGDANAGGGGSGGGGGSMARPVAAIQIGPDGVTVKPVFDATKLGIAAITAWGAMMLSLLSLRRK
jgi:uncharacterized spore protein YtfJ